MAVSAMFKKSADPGAFIVIIIIIVIVIIIIIIYCNTRTLSSTYTLAHLL